MFKQFVRDETGATAIEYGLIAALIAIGAIASMGTLGNEVAASFSNVEGELSEANKKGQ